MDEGIIARLPIVSKEMVTTWSVFAVNRQEVTNTPLASRDDSFDIQSMEQDMAKLPPYVFRRPNGSYRYKRNVPKKLRPLIGKDTLYRQLGDSYAEAMQNLPKVHAQIEQLFHTEVQIPSNERALAIIQGALGDEVADQVLAGQVVEYSQEDYALNDLARDIAGKLPQDVVRQVYAGRLQAEAMTLQTALGEYQEYKLEDDPDSREAEQRVARLRKDLALR